MAGKIKRGTIWHMRMRVPVRYKDVVEKDQKTGEPKKFIFRSLKTDSEKEAAARLEVVEKAEIARLDALLAGRKPEGKSHYQVIAELAAARGHAYKPVQELVAGPIEELTKRLLSLAKEDPEAMRKDIAQADLGTVAAPDLMLSELVAKVEDLSSYDNRMKNSSQMYTWRRPRERAVENLISAIGGDKPVAALTDEDVQKHEDWWINKVEEEGVKASTANKDFGNMGSLLNTYARKALKIKKPQSLYSGVVIEDKFETRDRKPEFTSHWIHEVILADGAFDGLNDEARAILTVVVETGCRQSEVHNLLPEEIFLDDPYPHFVIKNVEGQHEAKNLASVRKVPLVGRALEEMRKFPAGFPRYRNTRNFSATANKFMREHGLLETDRHTAGGLRHSWESRLKAATLHSDDRAEMMGHSVKSERNRELYGDEMPLGFKHQIAELISFKPPFGPGTFPLHEEPARWHPPARLSARLLRSTD